MEDSDSVTFWSFSADKGDGTTLSFSDLKGKTVLVVNTASKCGFSYQYDGLEALYRKFRNRDFVVLAFPCNQFAHQEPGSDEQIARFCTVGHNVTFPVMGKVEVNGPNAHPLFVWLKEQAPGRFGSSIKWNFTKFLVSPEGTVTKRYAPKVEPQALEKDIERLLPR
jgi:glutathione peroxidase